MKIKLILAAFILSLTSYAIHAQDLIYKKNKDIILAKILEIGVDEIKYKEFKNLDGPTISIAKNELWKIKMENGKETYFTDEMTNPNVYADNKKNAIKVDFLAPMFGQFTLGYERSLKPGASVEFQLGLIGLGVNNYSEFTGSSVGGVFLRAGYKFIKSPDFYLKGMRYAHILKGSYIKPEITFGQCTENFQGSTYNNNTGNYNNVSQSVSLGAIMLNFGKQWVMNDIFIVDYFFGFGYGFKSNNVDLFSNNVGIDKSIYWSNSHAFMGPYGGFPLAWGGGLKVGILIK